MYHDMKPLKVLCLTICSSTLYITHTRTPL